MRPLLGIWFFLSFTYTSSCLFDGGRVYVVADRRLIALFMTVDWIERPPQCSGGHEVYSCRWLWFSSLSQARVMFISFFFTFQTSCHFYPRLPFQKTNALLVSLRHFDKWWQWLATEHDRQTFFSPFWQSVRFPLPSKLHNLLLRLPAAIFTQWILEEPRLWSCYGSGVQWPYIKSRKQRSLMFFIIIITFWLVYVPVFHKTGVMFPCSLRYFPFVPFFSQTPGRLSSL